MFSNNDFYNLDDATKTIAEKKLILDLYIKIESLTQLLIKHEVTNEYEIEACENYIKTLPHIKLMIEQLHQLESKINEYKNDPQQHLRDLMKAKMSGQIR